MSQEIDRRSAVCFNRGMTSDIMKPLPDDILGGLLKLPIAPKSALVGSGFERAKFPPRNTLLMQRLWCAIPSAHKHEELGCISPEAFNVVRSML